MTRHTPQDARQESGVLLSWRAGVDSSPRLSTAARALELSPVTTTEWARMGKIPAVRVGERNFLVQPEAIKTALAAGVVGERISKRQKRNGNGNVLAVTMKCS